MTETRLRTRTHLVSYGLATLFFALLAQQNLRYGFYNLFYGALLLCILGLAGMGYTLLQSRRQLRVSGHAWLLAAMALCVATATLDQPLLAGYWLYPLLLLNLLLLSPRRGLLLCGLSTVLIWGLLLVLGQPVQALNTLVGAALLTGTAGVYAWRYHHSALSVEELAIIEPITGAYNERYLEETLQKELSRTLVTGHPLSLIHLQVDYLGEFQDMLASTELQPLMRKIGEQLEAIIRAGDSHYYVGDGNFFLLLPFTPEEGARVFAERVRRTIAEHQWGPTDSLTVSLGCTTCEDGEATATALRATATAALGQAQQRGHNRVWHQRLGQTL